MAFTSITGGTIGTPLLWSAPGTWSQATYYPGKPYSVTNCVTSGGLIKVTVTGHPFATSDIVFITSVGGTTEANAKWTITKIDANNFTLNSSTFTNTYTSGGTVVRGDVVTIATTSIVSVDTADAACGQASGSYDLTINGSLYNNSTLTLRCLTILSGSVSTLTLNAGTTLTIDSTQGAGGATYRINQSNSTANIQSLGTSGSHVTIQALGSGSNNGWIASSGTAGNCGFGTFTYTDFIRIGDASNSLNFDQGSASNTISFTNCTFTNGGSLILTPGANCICNVTNCIWTGTIPTNPLNIFGSSALSAGSRLIQGNSFDKQVIWHTGPKDWQIKYNYFHLAYDPTANNIRWNTFTGNFVRSTIDGIPANGDILNSYWFYDVPAKTDPNMVSGRDCGNVLVDSNVGEFNGTSGGGTWFYVGAGSGLPTSPTTYTVSRNISILNTSGAATGMLFVNESASANIIFSLEHNTGYINGNTNYGFALLGDTGVSSIAGQCTSARANLGVGLGTTSGYLMNFSSTCVTDTVPPSLCGYNGAYNLAASVASAKTTHRIGYGGNTSNTIFSVTTLADTTDVNANPTFVDSARNLAKWGQVRQSTAGTVASALTKLQADPTLIADCLSYVKEGYRPTNTAFNGASYGGDAITTDANGNPMVGTIGAMASTTTFTSAGLAGSSTLAANALQGINTTATLAGGSSLSANALQGINTTASLVGSSSWSATSALGINTNASLSGSSSWSSNAPAIGINPSGTIAGNSTWSSNAPAIGINPSGTFVGSSTWLGLPGLGINVSAHVSGDSFLVGIPTFPISGGTFAQALQAYLSTSLTVPIWALHIPQVTTYPAIVYTPIFRQPFYTLYSSAGLTEVEYQLDVWGTDYLTCENIAEELRGLLDSYRGLMAGIVLVSGVRMTRQHSDFEPNSFGSDDGYFRVSTDYRFFYQSSIPHF